MERETRKSEDIGRGLKALDKVDAFLAVPGGLPTGYYSEIIRTANAKRVPTMFHARTGSTMGALASYGTSDKEIARQAARYVVKILKGEKGGDLPIARPKKVDFVINLKTAKKIGLTIPPEILAQADEVIK